MSREWSVKEPSNLLLFLVFGMLPLVASVVIALIIHMEFLKQRYMFKVESTRKTAYISGCLENNPNEAQHCEDKAKVYADTVKRQ